MSVELIEAVTIEALAQVAENSGRSFKDTLKAWVKGDADLREIIKNEVVHIMREMEKAKAALAS